MQVINSQLHLKNNGVDNFHPVLRFVAKAISFIFHPLFIPVYLSWFLIYQHPLLPAFTSDDKIRLLVRFFIMYTVFPLVTILLAKGLGFINSIYLKTQKDRIIPYVACGVYYFWMWYVLHNQLEFPKVFVLLSLAIFLASSAGLLTNSFIKVSMHAISVGVMITFLLLLALSDDSSFGIYLSAALFIAGLVCTARLITADHQPIEVYLGLVIGIVALLVAHMFV